MLKRNGVDPWARLRPVGEEAEEGMTTSRIGGRPRSTRGPTRLVFSLVALTMAALPTVAWSQDPTIETIEEELRPMGELTPGSMESRLGGRPGVEGSGLGIQPGRDEQLLGRIGTIAPRVPSSISQPDQGPAPAPRGVAAPEPLPIPSSPLYGTLELPEEPEMEVPGGGMTLDHAIDRLIHENLDLRAKSLEIPQARADVLTASLRANPIFYADAQLVPYGRFSDERPGGATQYDVNISHPVDFSRKRRARVAFASRAMRVTEAMYQDAVRMEINNLYTAYLDVLSARQTTRYAKASSDGLTGLIRATELLYEKDLASRADVNQVRAQKQIAEVGLADAEENLKQAKRRFGLLLNIPPEGAEVMEVQGTIEDRAPPPPPVDELVRIALEHRPDVVSFRLGVQAAEAGVGLAMANRYQDAYILYQPYTFQDNAPFGRKSATSWALGLTVPMPLYNRNQGNIERARINVKQSQIELAAIERAVQNEVVQAAKEYEVTARIVKRIRNEIVATSEKVKDDRFILFQSGEANVVSYLEAQRSHNDNVKAYLDTAVRHRRAMLNLNTAVGQRLLP